MAVVASVAVERIPVVAVVVEMVVEQARVGTPLPQEMPVAVTVAKRMVAVAVVTAEESRLGQSNTGQDEENKLNIMVLG